MANTSSEGSPYPYVIDTSSSLLRDNQLVIFGGTDLHNFASNSVFILDLQLFTWKKLVTLNFSAGHVSMDSISPDVFLIYGGSNNGIVTNQMTLVSMDGNVIQITGDIEPPPRESHAAHFVGNKLYLFGG